MAVAVLVPAEHRIQVGLVADLERVDVLAPDPGHERPALGGGDRGPAGGEVDAEDQLRAQVGRQRLGRAQPAGRDRVVDARRAGSSPQRPPAAVGAVAADPDDRLLIGRQPFSRFSSTGSIASGLLPVYWWTARYLERHADEPLGHRGAGRSRRDGGAQDVGGGRVGRQPAEARRCEEPSQREPERHARPRAGHGEAPGAWWHMGARRDAGSARRSARPLDASSCAAQMEASALTDLVVITGFSGAGKSTAMAVFEDAEYFCVDNLPPEMIRSLVDLFMHSGARVARAAVVSDARGREHFDGLTAMLDELRSSRRPATGSCSWRPTRRRCCVATRRPAGATRWRRGARSRPGSPASASCWRRCASGPTS